MSDLAGNRMPPTETWELSLFVAGNDAVAESTIKGLEQFCTKHLRGRFTIEVVDIVKDPKRADECEIVATPTLIRRKPLPQRRIIGDLTLSAKVLTGLGISADEEERHG